MELEEKFEKAKYNIDELRLIEAELQHRSTNRAHRLLHATLAGIANHSYEPAPEGIIPTSLEESAPQSQEAPITSQIEMPLTESESIRPEKSDDNSLPKLFSYTARASRIQPEQPNEPEAILASWSALEALSPQTYKRPEDLGSGDPRIVAKFNIDKVPWNPRERSKPKYKLFYQIILGSISMQEATEHLMDVFGADEEKSRRSREKAAIAAILVDQDGILVDENGISISSFAWALPLALEKQLEDLGNWPGVESEVLGKLENILRRHDTAGKPIPLDNTVIAQAYDWLTKSFGLKQNFVEPPAFALRIYHYFKAKNPPEPNLLNSFYLGDLAKASALARGNSLPKGLSDYLGINPPESTKDLLKDLDSLEETVAPKLIPHARWVSSGGYPLVMLQQSAVNLVESELNEKSGILSVNGPPGTGKTTLLRDVVAGRVLDRAEAMASFTDPNKAFTPSGQKMAAGGRAFFHLYELDAKLKGHEMLVASSNNKAVENVSRELPDRKALGKQAGNYSYFKSLSDNVFNPDSQDENTEEIEPIDTWGIIAAVLGNSKNRFNFQQNFWWHDDFGFRLYLKAAKGDEVLKEIKDPKTGKVIKKVPPAILLKEKPPIPKQAAGNWSKARRHFLSLKEEVRVETEKLDVVRKDCLELNRHRKHLKNIGMEHAELESQETKVCEEIGEISSALSNSRSQLGSCQSQLNTHRYKRPGFFARMFRTQRWKSWSNAEKPYLEAMKKAASECSEIEARLGRTKRTQEQLRQSLLTSKHELEKTNATIDTLTAEIDVYREALDNRVVDRVFFEQGHDIWNLSAPWLPDNLHRKREELFLAALDLHRAFIDVTAQKILHNLSVLMDAFSDTPKDEAKRKLLGDMWSTLFLVTPVISTTFASVDRMLGALPNESLGWLLIDEAGQALPQAAVGAIMRAKRSVVVGDPLQIPPVVSLPEQLVDRICDYFKIDKSDWAAPEASAQTLADKASTYQASFHSDQGPRNVGIPLLVHRRCMDPMFTISNNIAYDGQMVHAAVASDENVIGDVLGKSKWLDIDGDAANKWCQDEGEKVIEMLRQLADAELKDPDIFIITPFRIVAEEMRRMLRDHQDLFSRFGVKLDDWIYDRVGTIHTVQGREADSVILLLGAPKDEQQGARNWAGAMPNIFNVAVSRAKQNLYVVGSHSAWFGAGYAREMAMSLEISSSFDCGQEAAN